jgi:hypothetical protein
MRSYYARAKEWPTRVQEHAFRCKKSQNPSEPLSTPLPLQNICNKVAYKGNLALSSRHEYANQLGCIGDQRFTGLRHSLCGFTIIINKFAHIRDRYN